MTNERCAKFHPAFTLIEVMLVVGMVALVALAVTGIVYSSYQDWEVVSRRSNVLQDGRAAIDFMVRTLRQAKGFIAISAPAAPAGFITFTSVDDITEEFRINMTANELEYGEPGSLSALTGPVNSLSFTYYDLEGNALNPTDLADIRSISIQAEFADAENPSLTFTLSGRVFVPTDDLNPPCLIAWWELNDGFGLTATDSSGNGYDGSLENMDGTEWTAGIIGGALDFDGTSGDQVQDADGEDYINGLSAFTISMWIQSDLTGTNKGFIIGKEPTGDDNVFALRYDSSGADGGGTNVIKAGISVSAVTKWQQLESSSNVQTTSWQHLALTWSSGNQLALYIDGSLDSPTDNEPARTGSIIGSNTLIIGRGAKDEGSESWDGRIDDVRIYRCVLDPADIAELAACLRYREFTEAETASDTTSITIDTPAGVSEGDLLIAAVATDGDTSLSMAPPGGQGWTQIDIDDYSSQVTLAAWWKNADASESPTHQFTWTGDRLSYGWMMRFTGHDSSDPVNFWAADGESSSTPTSPALTTTVDNTIILRLGAFDDADITVDDPGLSGHMAITMDSSSEGGPWTQIQYDDFEAGFGNWNDGGQNCIRYTGSTYAHQGSAAIDLQDNTSTSVMTTGNLALAAYNEVKVDFWYRCEGMDNSNEDFWLQISTNGGSDFTTVEEWNLDDEFVNGQFYSDSVIITGYTLNNTTQLRFRCDASHNADDVYIDEVLVEARGGGPSPGSVSGGAGYVSQVSAGDSGTSNFSLTASQEARTLTIAIAPAP